MQITLPEWSALSYTEKLKFRDAASNSVLITVLQKHLVSLREKLLSLDPSMEANSLKYMYGQFSAQCNLLEDLLRTLHEAAIEKQGES